MKKIKKLLSKLDKKVIKKFNLNKLKYKVSNNLASTTIMGLYIREYGKHTLLFNKTVYMESGFKKYKEVIIHEYSHFIANLIFGSNIQSHGREWKMIMRSLGVRNPSATTRAFIGIKKKESDVKVKCKCRIIFISANRATRMENGKRYICSLCSKKIKKVENEPN